MDKNKIILIVIVAAVTLMVAPRLRALPVVSKLPTV